MDSTVIRKPNTYLKDKLLRFKPITFIKKYIFVFLFILFAILSTVFGLWNIRKYQVTNISGEDIDINVETLIESYIQQNVLGKNYFLLSAKSIEDDMVSKISYLEDISITKILPNNFDLIVHIYKPELVAILKEGKCYLLCEDGYVLEHLCVDAEEGCCKSYTEMNQLYTLTASMFDISKLENGKEKLLYMDNISKVIKTIKSVGYGISGISVTEELLDIKTSENRLLRFSFNQDLDIQLSRFIVVVGKIKSDNMTFKSLDLRFERPVMKK